MGKFQSGRVHKMNGKPVCNCNLLVGDWVRYLWDKRPDWIDTPGTPRRALILGLNSHAHSLET